MAFTGNMFALLDDEDGPKPAARAPAKAAPAAEKKSAKMPEKSSGAGGAKRQGARAPRAPREFEGEVVGTEGRSGRPRNSDRRKPRDGDGRRNDRADRSGRGHEGPHRGGAGKGGWGKPGDEAKAPQESNDDGADAPAPEPEEPDNEVTIDDYEKEKAAKKAALAASFAKKGESSAKTVDDSAFASMTLAAKSDDSMTEFALANGGAKAKRDRERTKSEKKVVDTGFRTAPSQDADDRPARGGRGGRGGRGDRDGGRGRGGRGGDRPARAPGGGRGGFSAKIDDSAAFPTLA